MSTTEKTQGTPKCVKTLALISAAATVVYFIITLVLVLVPDLVVSQIHANPAVLDEYVISQPQLMMFVGMFAVCLFFPILSIVTVAMNGKGGFKSAVIKLIVAVLLVIASTSITKALSTELSTQLNELESNASMAVFSFTNTLVAKVSYIYMAARTMLFCALSIEAFEFSKNGKQGV